MSASSDDPSDRRRVSKVSISPISSDLLVVRIRKISSEVKEEDIPKMSNALKPIHRHRRSKDQKENSNYTKSTMTDEQQTASSYSQTVQSEQIASHSKTDNLSESTPCLKHAAQNLSRKALDIPSEKISLCNSCSKSMLSYIFLVQDFLDSLAKEISGDETAQCLQCARQEVRSNIASIDIKEDVLSNRGNSASSEASSEKHSDYKSKSEGTGDSSNDRQSKRTVRNKSHRQESKKNEDQPKRLVSTSVQRLTNQQGPQVDFLYNVSPSLNVSQEVKMDGLSNFSCEKRIIKDQQSSNINKEQNGSNQPPASYQQNFSQLRTLENQNTGELVTEHQGEFVPHSSPGDNGHHSEAASPPQSSDKPVAKSTFIVPMERTQPNYETVPSNAVHQRQDDTPDNYTVQSPTLFKDGVDGIVSTLSNAEREIYDSARDGAGWESLTESQERLGAPPTGSIISSEAFVTSCRNNAEAIGCLVVGTSLLLCRTSRTLCVLVSDGVSTAFRGALSSVFQVVQYVRSLDSLGTTKLALLEQPELGITFEKLNIWRLVQFTKCVYLNPDTLVIQNCDELFCREELSAVPDIGWPDCFNSGVFVFSPSVHTFWQLLEFAERQGSYDGGDQGLLNSYFNSWSSDISKKLSFIYNLMANVSYTYTPAFRQFGRNVKIVQFHGSFKPWHVKFFTNSGQVSPSSSVHPTYIQFVHIWLNIFRISALRLMSQEIQSYAASQETICAVEILRFFPLPKENESDFFLTPPSVRLRLAEKKLSRTSSMPLSEARRRKSAEFFRYTSNEDITIPDAPSSEKVEVKDSISADVPETEASALDAEGGKPKDSISDVDEVFKEKDVTTKEEVRDENSLPGAEVGDYKGMKAWEQGRMDYQGSDSSDKVIKRLEFLMSRPK